MAGEEGGERASGRVGDSKMMAPICNRCPDNDFFSEARIANPR